MELPYWKSRAVKFGFIAVGLLILAGCCWWPLHKGRVTESVYSIQIHPFVKISEEDLKKMKAILASTKRNDLFRIVTSDSLSFSSGELPRVWLDQELAKEVDCISGTRGHPNTMQVNLTGHPNTAMQVGIAGQTHNQPSDNTTALSIPMPGHPNVAPRELGHPNTPTPKDWEDAKKLVARLQPILAKYQNEGGR